MEISYQLDLRDKNYAKAKRVVGKLIYKGNPYLRWQKIMDLLIPFLFIICVLYVDFYLDSEGWLNSMSEYYEMDFHLISFVLVTFAEIVVLYCILIRPYFYAKTIASLSAPALNGKLVLGLEDDHFYSITAESTGYIKYSAIKTCMNSHNYFLIVLNSGLFIPIPHSEFVNEAQRLEFENFIQAKIIKNSSHFK